VKKSVEGEMQGLCLVCGLCCNGVLFADVRLEKGDEPKKLKALGLPVVAKAQGARFKQPCVALEGCRCRVYSERPSYCRKFECLLFKRVEEGEVGLRSAVEIVEKARTGVAKVEKLLAALGAENEHLPLRRRFQLQARRMEEEGDVNDERAQVFSELTLAFHELSLLLKEEFYP